MSLLFEPWSHGSLRLRNRVVMAPMTRRMAADDGIPTDAMVRYYERRAANEVGLIVSEGVAIDSRHAYDTITVPRFETAEQVAGWKRVVEAVHAAGGAFAPQLWHCGRLAADPIGPSAGTPPPKADGTPRPEARAMEAADFAQVLEAYRFAAAASKEIGCDAVEIHGAHGYLLDSFLSAKDNRRTDAYGGSLENRMRFPLEVVRAVRETVGEGFPVIYRFSQWKVDDYDAQKFHSPDDLAPWVGALRDNGVDILHVSTRDATDPAFDDGDRTLAGWTKELSGLPVIAVGRVGVGNTTGLGNADVADPAPALALLESGECDLLAVGRGLIANPDWVARVREGRWQDLQPYNGELLKELV